MITALRQLLFLGLAAALTWWALLRAPEGAPTAQPAGAAPVPVVAPPVSITTHSAAAMQRDAADPTPAPPPELTPAATTVVAPEPAPTTGPPPPELGARDGDEDATAAPEAATPKESPQRTSAEALQRDPALVEAARRELDGEVRRGFATVLVAAPEDQLDIARAFGEELVLVPRASLDPDAASPVYFRVDASGSVETVQRRPPLAAYRQYRDLFDYDYARLPDPLRALRRSVLARDEVYLFAALVPVGEWAVVVGRREEALARAGVEAGEVARFVLRYVRGPGDAFDLVVDELVLVDGRRLHPSEDL